LNFSGYAGDNVLL